MITLTINGAAREVDADPDMPLLWAIRDKMNLSGPRLPTSLCHFAS